MEQAIGEAKAAVRKYKEAEAKVTDEVSEWEVTFVLRWGKANPEDEDSPNE